jgi:hypothetical protein
MTEALALLLRIAGAGLILLALLHIPIGKQLRWKEDCKQLTPVNESVFFVHTLFICIVLVMMGLPCLIQPSIFLTPTPAGGWLTWSFAGFWFIRLYCQWFVYRADLWRGKRMETAVHWWFTFIWMALTGLFAACGAAQAGWLQ